MISFEFNLVTILVVAGIVVWGRVLVFYIYRRKYLSLPEIPQYNSTTIRIEHILLVLFAFFLIGGMVQQLLLYLKTSFTNDENLNRLTAILLPDFIAKIILIGIMAHLLRQAKISGLFRKTKTHHWVKILFISLLIYFALFPLVNVLLFSLGIYIVRDILNLTIEMQHPAIKVLNSPDLSNSFKFICIVLAGIVSPIAEEMFFRGMLQNYFLKLVRKPFWAILLASFVFMLVHIPMYQNLLALFVLGIILGWSYYRYQCLSVPIAVHAIFNSTTLLLWYFGNY